MLPIVVGSFQFTFQKEKASLAFKETTSVRCLLIYWSFTGYPLDWIKKILGSEDSFITFTKYAEESPIGSLGVTYLPYLFGERSPYFDASLSGGIFGLKAHHQQSDIIRAVMEGIAFSLRNVYENMGIEKNKIEKFRVTGGVVKNPFWLQIFADIFKAEIEILSFDEGPAYGAMLCAVAGIQEEDLFIRWQQANRVKAIYKPTEQASFYEKAYKTFVELSLSQVENTFPSTKRKEIINK
ncbi:FGGY-family carbohydrate kinase [Enterococcus pingfangensis]